MTVVARWWRGLRWYLRELTGEADYDRYRAAHPECSVLSRRDFERDRWERRSSTPGSRCC